MQRRAINALIIGLAVVVTAAVGWQLTRTRRVTPPPVAPHWTEQQYRELDALIAEGKLGAALDQLLGALATKLADEDRARLLLRLGDVESQAGDSTAAITNIGRARDIVISTFGDHTPALAPYDDALAAAERARGNIRRALQLHERSLALQPVRAAALLGRARTKLEAGDVTEADRDVTQAKALITKANGDMGPAFELAAEIADERGIPELAAQQRNSAHLVEPPEDKILSVARARLIARTADADLAHRIASVVSDKSDPALALAAGEALIHAGDNAAAATLLGAAAKRLGNEPTRTALHIMIALAKASQDPQAARTAISLYQAMPKLDRTDYDAMWALTKAPAR
jgi:tetratricopeptide (TPR) repeat protein